MKTRFLSILAVVLMTLTANAQSAQHEYVDLGLPSGTLWATCNIGASTPEEYGDYFAWGETEPKNDYQWETYKHSMGSNNTMTRYSTRSEFAFNGFTDNLTKLLPIDDAATANWGALWRMPTAEQMQELIDNCSCQWTQQNGVNGILVTGPNGGQIFLPASGTRMEDELDDVGQYGYYWSCSLTSEEDDYAHDMRFYPGYSGYLYPDGGRRADGRPVRAVQNPNAWNSVGDLNGDAKVDIADAVTVLNIMASGEYNAEADMNGDQKVDIADFVTILNIMAAGGVQKQVTEIVLSETSLSLAVNGTKTITATVLPSDATNKEVVWASNDPSIATVDQTGKVTAIAAGSCTVTCYATDGSGVTAECQVTVKKEDTMEYVDLGLPSGTLWATCNLGARSPEEYGDYFAWGETEPKDNYTWGTYKWMTAGKDDWNYINKYTFPDNQTEGCWYSGGQFVGDGKQELDPEDDAATALLGSSWQIPSVAQIYELLHGDYTTSEWTTQGGVYGRKVTSKKNGNSIFLPAAGWRSGATLYDEGKTGYYWSNSLGGLTADYAFPLNFDAGYWGVEHHDRFCGHPIRPVHVLTLVSEIVLSKEELTLKPGDSYRLAATVSPSGASNTAVSWESSNEAVATVNYNGYVTAVSLGTCTIICTAKDGSGTVALCQVRVKKEDTKEYVDLGLPSGTLWATCNVGASNPEEYGDYFAWGETELKDDYSWSTYFDTEDGGETFKKYNNDGGLLMLQPNDDAATANWGSEWQMPSTGQFNELIDERYTTTEWTIVNGVNGRKVTSKVNGKSIFLPAAGVRGLPEDDNYVYWSFYWSRTLSTDVSFRAYSLMIYSFSSGVVTTDYERNYGFSIRPVKRKPVPNTYVSNIILNETSMNLIVNEVQQLTATVEPEEARYKVVIWESSNTSVATVNSDGLLTAKSVGTCTITCSATDGSGVKAECQVTVTMLCPDNHHPHAIDLGLPSGTKWACCNVGASTFEDYGGYYAWGETTTRNDYDSFTYNYYKYTDEEHGLTKYCTQSKLGYKGFTDGKTELDPADDAATTNWGAPWRMPSNEQIKELIDSSYTTKESISLNGVNGRKITSKSNGKSIFLPAAGIREGTDLEFVGIVGDCWSRSLSDFSDDRGNSLYFYSIHINVSNALRWSGRSVRPICVQE